MDRRNFLRNLSIGSAATAGSISRIEAAPAVKPVSGPKETRSVNWKVEGFTCITCSVGLEVMLRGLDGVTRVSASYPGHSVSIGYDGRLTNEQTLRDFIQVCGFKV